MVTKIGNLTWLLIGIHCISAHASHLRLQVTTMQGKPIKAMTAGVPYLLEVIGTDITNLKNIIIEGLPDIYHESRGAYQTIQTINGKTQRSSQLTYYIRVDQPGELSLGPAHLEYQGQKIVSEQLHIPVRMGAKKKSEKIPSLYAQTEVNKNNVVVGEPLILTYTLYAKPTLHVMQCSQPRMNYQDSELEWKKSDQGSTTLNGALYNYVQWQATLVPTQAGSLVIPALGIVCIIQKTGGVRDLMGRMLQQFGFNNKKLEILSDPIVVTVDPLPAGNEPIGAIGVVEAISLECAPQRGCVGEGIVAKMSLVCANDTSDIKQPLLNLPPSLKYYPSKTVTIPMENHDKHTKVFEYIIQGVTPGTAAIPSHSFTFFNTKTRDYQTVYTQPITLTIEEVPQPCSSNSLVPLSNSALPQYRSLNHGGPWVAHSPKAISWYLFFMLISVPVLYYLAVLIRHLRTQYNNRMRVKKRRIFLKSMEKLNELSDANKPHEVYGLFIELFSQLWNVVPQEISQESVNDHLYTKLTSDTFQQWKEFFQHISHAAYGNLDPMPTLFVQSRKWITVIQKVS